MTKLLISLVDNVVYNDYSFLSMCVCMYLLFKSWNMNMCEKNIYDSSSVTQLYPYLYLYIYLCICEFWTHVQGVPYSWQDQLLRSIWFDRARNMGQSVFFCESMYVWCLDVSLFKAEYAHLRMKYTVKKLFSAFNDYFTY